MERAMKIAKRLMMGSGGAEHRGEDDAGGESGVEVRPDDMRLWGYQL